MIRHIYVHIPFCARICPYCAFYKDLLDRSQTQRFCEAILQELAGRDHSSLAAARARRLFPFTIYFGGGTPTALNIAQLEMLLRGFRERLDLSQLIEWSIEANPGSVSARKAAVLKKFGVNRISLGVQSWDDKLLKLLGREHDAHQAEESFRILRDAGYEHYEISNYARPGFESVHNRAYWLGKDYLGIGPSAVSTIGMQRWQNFLDYRAYIDRVLSGESPRGSSEDLTHEMKRTERIALALRTREGIPASELKSFRSETNELIALELLRECHGNLVLTRRGKTLADSIAEALV